MPPEVTKRVSDPEEMLLSNPLECYETNLAMGWIIESNVAAGLPADTPMTEFDREYIKEVREAHRHADGWPQG